MDLRIACLRSTLSSNDTGIQFNGNFVGPKRAAMSRRELPVLSDYTGLRIEMRQQLRQNKGVQFIGSGHEE